MINLRHYKKEEHAIATKFNDELEKHMKLTDKYLLKGEFDNAEQCLRHARTMIIELRRLHGNKRVDDQINEFVRRHWF